MTDKLFERETKELSYHFSEHEKRTSWLFQNANISELGDFEMQGDKISIKVAIDEVLY